MKSVEISFSPPLSAHPSGEKERRDAYQNVLWAISGASVDKGWKGRENRHCVST